jgi:hypothetical protein
VEEKGVGVLEAVVGAELDVAAAFDALEEEGAGIGVLALLTAVDLFDDLDGGRHGRHKVKATAGRHVDLFASASMRGVPSSRAYLEAMSEQVIAAGQ